MDDVNQDSFMGDLKDESLEKAKELAPWRAGLPWWVVLIEGAVLLVIGFLILINPEQTSVNVGIFLAVVLLVAGVIQLWAVIRDKAPENVDSLMAARGSVAVFAGATILLLYLLDYFKSEVDYLTAESGLVIFGLGCLTYGLTGFGVAISTEDHRRRSSLIEGVFFTLFGILLIYVLFAGSEALETAMTIIGWVAFVGGLALIGLAFYNHSKDQAPEELEEKADEAQKQDTTEEKVDARDKEPTQPAPEPESSGDEV